MLAGDKSDWVVKILENKVIKESQKSQMEKPVRKYMKWMRSVPLDVAVDLKLFKVHNTTN